MSKQSSAINKVEAVDKSSPQEDFKTDKIVSATDEVSTTLSVEANKNINQELGKNQKVNNKNNTNKTVAKEYTVDDLKAQIKPLSNNSFIAFFQKILRAWLTFWYDFSDKHPKLSKLIYQVAFVFIFSNLVTVVQYLITLIGANMMGLEYAAKEFVWPKVATYIINGEQQYWTIFGNAVLYENGVPVIGGGLGYFIPFMIATFIAQCINFPLQRNITFKSHGKIPVQIFWYFIGWIGIVLFTNSLNSLWLPFGAKYLPFAVYNILSMISMGGVSIVIFFFIFKIIFPDYNVVQARTAKKLEKLKNKNSDSTKIKKVEKELEEATIKANYSNAEKEAAKSTTQASSKSLAYFAIVKSSEKAKANGDNTDFSEKINKTFKTAAEAISAKETAINKFEALKVTA